MYTIKYSVQFSHSVVSDSLGPHGLQHARLPCPSPTPRPSSNSCPLSQWWNPTISSSVIPFSSCLQSFPRSGSFQRSQFFILSGQILELHLQHQTLQWIFRTISFRIDWFALLAVQGTLKSLLQHHGSKASILWCSAFIMVQLSHPYITIGNTIALTILTFVSKVISLLLICFLGLSLLFFQGVSFNFMAAVTICSDFGAQGYKVCHCFHHFPIYFPWSIGPDVRAGL